MLHTAERALGLQNRCTRTEEADIMASSRDEDALSGASPMASCQPLWFTVSQAHAHPIRFYRDAMGEDGGSVDEGRAIRPWLIRWRHGQDEPFSSLEERASSLAKDVLTVEVELVQALVDANYFVSRVAQCEKNLKRMGRAGLVSLFTRAYLDG